MLRVLVQALMQGHTTWRMRLGVCTIPEVADCHQRANETSDQMVCFLKCAWMIRKMGGSIMLGRSDGGGGKVSMQAA